MDKWKCVYCGNLNEFGLSECEKCGVEEGIDLGQKGTTKKV